MTLLPGTQLGSFEVSALIGVGGMGEVYRARDSKLGREVAIKVLPEVFAKDKDRLARFEREAKLLASLDHSNIASIYNLEEKGDLRDLTFETCSGFTRVTARAVASAPGVDICSQGFGVIDCSIVPLESLPSPTDICSGGTFIHGSLSLHRGAPGNLGAGLTITYSLGGHLPGAEIGRLEKSPFSERTYDNMPEGNHTAAQLPRPAGAGLAHDFTLNQRSASCVGTGNAKAISCHSELSTPKSLLLFAALLAGCASYGHEPRGVTTLSQPSILYDVIQRGWVDVEWGEMTARLVGNDAIEPGHREGYNGIIEIRYDGGPSPFVPQYAGLNLEHVNNGRIFQERDLQFEPRRHAMEIRRIDERTYELYQPVLPNTGLESCTRFEFREPHLIDVTFECIPRKDNFPYDHLNIFWASYILEPEYSSIYFLGRPKGEKGEKWIEGASPKHGVHSTHRSATDDREIKHEEPFPLTLVFNESEYEYTHPFYYGRYDKYVWIMMFREEDQVRLAQSPSGGGWNNPAWDFHWFIERPEIDQLYRLRYRVAYRPWAGRNNVFREYRRFRSEFERPDVSVWR